MKLSEKQVGDLKKFSMIINSLNYEDGLTWYYDHSDEWEELQGPYNSSRRDVDELGFLPGSIEELFEEIKDEFDTDNFYNEYYGSYYGKLEMTINPIKKSIDCGYLYYSMAEENSNVEKSFIELERDSDQSNRSNFKQLTTEEFLTKMKEMYGSHVELTYNGGGDDGYINGTVDSDSGEVELNEILENISYEILENYFGGWEINEGSFGRINIDFDNQTVTIEHAQNIEEMVDNEYITLKF